MADNYCFPAFGSTLKIDESLNSINAHLHHQLTTYTYQFLLSLPSPTLAAAADLVEYRLCTKYIIPRARTATRQKRAFSIVGPSVWNDLPSELRSLPRDLSSSFYKLLKTLLFGRAWAGSASE